MNTKLVKIVLSAVLVTAVAGCSQSVPEKFTLSPGQKEAIKQNKSPLILLLTADGHFLAADENGKTLKRCTFGTKGSAGVEPCRGLQTDFAVLSLTTLSIIHSKKNPECLTFTNPATGAAQEYCE